MICKYCKNLDELETVYPDAPHHGGNKDCEECGAEYYEEYGGNILACNKQAKINHPELKTL